MKRTIVILAGAVILAVASGAAASGYLITRIEQIKPSVRAQLSRVRVVSAYGPSVVLGTGDLSVQSSLAVCPHGTVVTGGGWYGSPGSPAATLVTSAPDLNRWLVVMQNDSTEHPSFQAIARCESR